MSGMKVTPMELPEVLLIEPRVFEDARGFFLETYHEQRYRAAGIPWRFVQDNLSVSQKNVVRGLHLQHPRGQGKLVQVLTGEVLDVAVDVRHGSPSFGRWAGARLSGDNHLQVWVPPGFAHGFAVLSARAVFAYKCTEVYLPEQELGVAFDDPDLGITWQIEDPIVSARDRALPRLRDIDPERLPRHG
jgi:dTDP-4-dehydrorhamnose 3,5-epimerase